MICEGCGIQFYTIDNRTEWYCNDECQKRHEWRMNIIYKSTRGYPAVFRQGDGDNFKEQSKAL